MKRGQYLIIAALAVLGVAGFAPAYAQSLTQRFQKDLPAIEFLPPAEFDAKTKGYAETPYGDKALAYEVRLPADWEQYEVKADEFKLSDYAPLEVALYKSPVRPDEQSFFRIQAIDLPAPVSAENWFTQYIDTNGYTLEGIKVHSSDKVEALIVRLQGDATYVVRLIAEIVGDRVILAQFFVPTSHWQEERVLQAQSMASFKLSNKSAFIFDQTRRFVFPNIAYFEYPLNWKVQASILYSSERKFVRLIKNAHKEFLDGQMDVLVIPRAGSKGIAKELATLRAQYKKGGFTVGPIIEQKKGYGFSPWITFGAAEAYQAYYKEGKVAAHELWFAVLANKDYFIIASLLTPGRKTDFIVWSENAETFKSAVESLQPLESPKAQAGQSAADISGGLVEEGVPTNAP